ncbi:hypothetical protein CN955_21385 [Priestia megaterium]|nr:hypothetical protein CN955_21385 [Priestia megaterium]
MFSRKKDDIQDHLIKERYDIKEFMNKNGDGHYFKIGTTWPGIHIVKLKDGFFRYDIQRVK